MTSEGGGKLRQKRNRNSKPYLRPKSVINRVTDAVRSVFNPSWITGLVTWNQGENAEDEAAALPRDEEADEEVRVDAEGEPAPAVASTSQTQRPRSALNAVAGPSGYVPPAADRRPAKPRLPTDGDYFLNWNDNMAVDDAVPSTSTGGPTLSSRARLTSTPVNSFLLSSSLLPPDHGGEVAGTPFAAAAAFAQRQQHQHQLRTSSEMYSGAPVVRQNGVGAEPGPRPASSSSSAASGSSSSRFAKLGNIGKLPAGCSNARKTERENSANVAEGGDSHSECSEESVSTSGCSSMIPHPDKRNYQRDVLELDKPQKLGDDQHSTIPSESRGGSEWDRSNHLEDRSSVRSPSFLWSDSLGPLQCSKPQPAANSSRPRFNPSLFGTTILADNSILNGSRGGTPLVNNNKVAYGFGSSYRSRLSALAPYNVASSKRKQVQVKSMASANAEVMSITTKRILETLEKMNTPLMDAKKIPANRSLDPVLESPLSFTQTSYRRRPCLANKGASDISRVELSAAGASRVGPPTRHLQTPGSSASTRSTYLRTYDASNRPPVESAVASTSHTDGGSRAPPATSDSAPKARGEGGGKIKNAMREKLHYSSRAAADDDEVSELPNLPSIPLPIKNLPVFNLLPSAKTAAAGQSTPVMARPALPHHVRQSVFGGAPSTDGPINGTATTSATSGASAAAFNFSSPLANSPFGTPAPTVSRRQEQPKFTFSSPIPVNDAPSPATQPSVAPKAEPTPSVSLNFAYQAPASAVTFSTPTSSSASPLSARPRSTVSTPAATTSPASVPAASRELKTGSVMDVLRRSSGAPVASPTDKLKTTGSVMDVLAKMTSSASTPFSASTVTPAPLAFGNQFKPAAGTWECSACMIRNSEDKTKCAACETARPGAAKKPTTPAAAAAPSSSISATSGFGDRFKPAASTWECSVCMIRNAEDKNKCVACETARPGGAAAVAPPAEAAASSLDDRFKMASGMWECDTCLVRNAPAAPKCIACESPRPGSAAAAASSSSSAALSSAGASVFKFGIPSNSTAPTTVPFKFGITATASTSQPPASAFSLPASTTASSTGSFFKFGVSPVVAAAADSESAKGSATAVGDAATKSTDKPKETAPAETRPPSVAAPPAFSASLSGAVKIGEEFKLPVVTATQVSATEKASTVAAVSTSSPALTTFAFGGGQKPAETALSTASPFGSASAVTQSSGGFGFKFGATATTTTNAAKPTPAGDGSLTSVPELKFGDGAVPKLNFATPATTTSTTSTVTAVEQASAPPPSGGFQFSFGKTDGAPSTGSLKRDSSEMSGERPQKMAAPASNATGLPTFGAFAASTPAAPGAGFVFGSAAAAPAAPATLHPVFGAAAVESKPAPSSNFTFGATPARPSLFAPAAAKPAGSGTASPFGGAAAAFGGAQQPAPSAAFGGATASGGAFAFGTQPTAATTAGSTPFGAPVPAPTGFGSSAPSMFGSSATPAFGTQQQQQQPTSAFSSTFSFGTTPSLAFGATAQPQNGGIFQFSGSQNAAPTQASGPGFGFGQQSLPSQQQPQAFSFDPSSPVNLNFSAGGAQPGAQLPTFSAAPNPFDAQQTANRTGRNIKKARRRTQLK